MNTFADKKTTQVKSAIPAAKAPTQASMSGFSTARSMGGGQNAQGAPMQIRPMSPGTVPAQGKSAEEKREARVEKREGQATKKKLIAQKRHEFSEFLEATDHRRRGTPKEKKVAALTEVKRMWPDYEQYQTSSEKRLEKRVLSAQARNAFAKYVKETDHRRTGTQSAKKAAALAEYKSHWSGYAQHQTPEETRLEKSAARRRDLAAKKGG